jgi:hypothetical protein
MITEPVTKVPSQFVIHIQPEDGNCKYAETVEQLHHTALLDSESVKSILHVSLEEFTAVIVQIGVF